MDVLERLLAEANYDRGKSEYLIRGFREGFSIGYEGIEDRRDMSENIPLGDMGTKTDLWNKVMKEVKLNRYAGPYKLKNLPVRKQFVQSPIGLVPKAGGKTKLIFHLSYDFKNGNKSINASTPDELCHVKYKDLDYAIDACIKLLKEHGKTTLFFAKTDVQLAFRLAPILVKHRKYLVMKAENPITGEDMFFIDLCLPFGASISCAVFQAFSDALKHLIKYLLWIRDIVTNYLDDFLFIAVLRKACDDMMTAFVALCKKINCPLSEEKTEWSLIRIIFLGTLLDGERYCLCIPEEKCIKALNQVLWFQHKRTATVKQVQCLTGILNFLNRAIVPGRVFTRRMYAKLKTTDSKGRRLKQYHHISVGREYKSDCKIWEMFLDNAEASVLCRPFTDSKLYQTSDQLAFYTDASGVLGFGCFFDGRWTFGSWERKFLEECEPSIEFLELYALCVAIMTWEYVPSLNNKRIIIFCDNQAVVSMVNNTTSGCKNCMVLLRMLVLNNLKHNRRIAVKYIRSADNILADSLSRGDFERFWANAPANTRGQPDSILNNMKNIRRIWIF